MKTTTIITYAAFALFALACFALSQLANAQCPQICDVGLRNTAFGVNALPGDSGLGNTAIGDGALENNMGTFFQGDFNTATGAGALTSNTTGNDNTATGGGALEFNTTGHENTAIGGGALKANTTGNYSVAIGFDALALNTTGFANIAIGNQALYFNTIGYQNTANGLGALESNRTGKFNTANGVFALYSNTSGSDNIALGYGAGRNLTMGGHNIDIGNQGVDAEANTIRIGTAGTHTNAYIAGINGVTVPTGIAVIVDSSGHLGTTTSSVRFKEAIKPMDNASEAILALKPVTFRYKRDLDPEGIPQFGLVAEEVEKVNPDLVARDENGKPHTVRYEAVNAMLLNEFLKARRQIGTQQKQIDALTAGLQKVSAQLEVSKPVPQTVLNNQ